MNGFTYSNPVKVVFGLGTLKQAGARRFGVGVNSARSILAEVKSAATRTGVSSPTSSANGECGWPALCDPAFQYLRQKETR